jgi:hypothetical protein
MTVFDARTIDRDAVGFSGVIEAMDKMVFALSALRAVQFDRVT